MAQAVGAQSQSFTQFFIFFNLTAPSVAKIITPSSSIPFRVRRIRLDVEGHSPIHQFLGLVLPDP